MTKRKENSSKKESMEFAMDSRYSSKKERQLDGKKLMKARLDRMNNVSDEDIKKAKLVQLKLKMDEYIQKPVHANHRFFTTFLATYIDTIYNRRSNFANDIGITPIKLSQILNSHREPKDEFMLKLMIHSEKTFKNVCQFHKKVWYQIYYHEKICNTMSSQDEWRPNIEKHIKIRTLVNS